MASLAPLISVEWLAAHHARDDVKVIDGTWVMPGTENPLSGHYIPGALIFDIDVIADPKSEMAHMLPGADLFAQHMSDIGISEHDNIVIYDRHGIRAAPRVWWMFKMFGHENVAILDGGLPAWVEAGHPITDQVHTPETTTSYQTSTTQTGVIDQAEIKASLDATPQILDARSRARFEGTTPEPRKGLRSGHIPGSLSFPFGDMFKPGGTFKELDELASMISEKGIDLTQPVIATCGSGVTAAGIAFTLHRLGCEGVRVYDGSWTEWGASDAPISTGSIQ